MKIIKTISNLVKNHSSVVIYSSAIQLARSQSLNINSTAENFTSFLLEELSSKSILMPTFIGGYNSEKFVSLDSASSKTGLISEIFRKKTTTRTLSAFFPFSAIGPSENELKNLRPIDAWGEGSLYEWIYRQNSIIVTVGLHPTHCSFTHYAEYLCSPNIKYRKRREFSGTVQLYGKKVNLKENLFIRHTEPKAINDFTWLSGPFRTAGQKIENIDGVLVSAITSQKKISVILPYLKANPNALISNATEIFPNV